MELYRRLFKKQHPSPPRQMITELTEFELSESHKIILGTETLVEDLLEHISEQQLLITRYEEELRILRFGHSQSDRGTIKIIEKGSGSVS